MHRGRGDTGSRRRLLLCALLVSLPAVLLLGSRASPKADGGSVVTAPPRQAEVTAAPTVARTPSPGRALLRAGLVGVVVFPSTVDPDRHPKRVSAIRETWGRPFEAAERLAFVGGAPVGDEPRWLLPPSIGPELRHQGSADVLRFALRKAHEEWAGVRWVLKADDITFVIPEHLSAYLAGRDHAAPQLLGRRLKLPAGSVFCSGGAGYVLSSGAVGRLLASWCSGSGWQRSQGGDIVMSSCLAAMAGEDAVPDTRADGGGERFNVYGPSRTWSGSVDSWFRQYTPWYAIPSGPRSCATDPATFHYVDWGEARALDSILRDRARWTAMTDQQRVAEYPSTPRAGFSYYSHAPRAGDAMWTLLLSHIKQVN